MSVGLVVDIIGNTANLDRALQKSTGGIKGFGGALGGISPVALGAAGAAVAAGVAIVGMTKAAAEDRDEQRKLTQVIKAAGAATGNYEEEVQKAIESGQEMAFTDSETRKGLQPLITATGSVTKATKLMSLAQDVARLSGVDLETAAKAVAKAETGQDAALRKLVPGIGKTKSATDTLARATQLAAGQANTYANSAEGMGARGADAFAEIGETIGEVFLPIMDEVLPAIIPVISALGTLIKAVLPVLIPLVKLLATALGIVANVLSTVVTWLARLISWLGSAIYKVGKFLDSINPFKSIKLPSLPFLSSASASAPAAASVGARAGGGGRTGAVTINVHGAIDPEATARQIRRILNGHAVRTGSAVTGI